MNSNRCVRMEQDTKGLPSRGVVDDIDEGNSVLEKEKDDLEQILFKEEQITLNKKQITLKVQQIAESEEQIARIMNEQTRGE